MPPLVATVLAVLAAASGLGGLAALLNYGIQRDRSGLDRRKLAADTAQELVQTSLSLLHPLQDQVEQLRLQAKLLEESMATLQAKSTVLDAQLRQALALNAQLEASLAVLGAQLEAERQLCRDELAKAAAGRM